MSDSNVSTAREAFMAELLQDVDALMRRIEQADESLAGRIEQATKDAAGKALLAARLNFESMIDKQAEKLTGAGRHAAALIGDQIDNRAAQLATVTALLEERARWFLLLWGAVALTAGVVGGVIGTKLISA